VTCLVRLPLRATQALQASARHHGPIIWLSTRLNHLRPKTTFSFLAQKSMQNAASLDSTTMRCSSPKQRRIGAGQTAFHHHPDDAQAHPPCLDLTFHRRQARELIQAQSTTSPRPSRLARLRRQVLPCSRKRRSSAIIASLKNGRNAKPLRGLTTLLQFRVSMALSALPTCTTSRWSASSLNT
jgi:hypothetical protein